MYRVRIRVRMKKELYYNMLLWFMYIIGFY